MRLLVVEDDPPLREAISVSASNWHVNVPEGSGTRRVAITEVFAADDLASGRRLLQKGVDLLIVDVRLGEERGVELVKTAQDLDHPPTILAMSGQATAAEAFELSTLGVRGYLGKPFDMHELRASIQAVFETPPEIASGAMAQVGHRPIHAVQDEVKTAMLKRALQLEDGNITRAGKRLGVSRAAVQQMIDRYGLPRPGNTQ